MHLIHICVDESHLSNLNGKDKTSFYLILNNYSVHTTYYIAAS